MPDSLALRSRTTGQHEVTAPITYTACLLGYLYVSRFVTDAVLILVLVCFLMAGRLRINVTGLTLMLAATVLMVMQVFSLGGQIEHPSQPLHLLYLLLVVFAVDDGDYDPLVLQRFCRITTAMNCLFLAGALVPGLREVVLWGLDRTSSGRLQGVLPEPSFLALYSVFNFFVLLRVRDEKWAFANLVPLVATFSFSGVIVFLFLGTIFFRSAWRPLFAAGVIVVGMLGIAYLLAPDVFASLVISRGIEILTGGNDESMTLRLFAPVDLVRSVLANDNSLLGLGSGNVEHYIQYSQVELPNHWRQDGQRSTQPDSIVAFIIAAYGVVGAAIIFASVCVMLSNTPLRREYSVVRWYTVIVALFSGLFISPHFLVWFYLLRQERLHREDSPVGSAPAVSI